MAPEKEGGRTRRKAGAGRGAGERIGRTAEKAAGQHLKTHTQRSSLIYIWKMIGTSGSRFLLYAEW